MSEPTKYILVPHWLPTGTLKRFIETCFLYAILCFLVNANSTLCVHPGSNTLDCVTSPSPEVHNNIPRGHFTPPDTARQT